MEQVHSINQLNHIIETNNTFLLLKHSLTCPISAHAKEEYDSFCKEQNAPPMFILHVQEARELSNDIEKTYEVKHESPQALLFNDNEVVWNGSHSSITKESLHKAVKTMKV